MVRALLENNGIPAIVQGEDLWAARGDLPLGPRGAPSVCVDENDAAAARALIEEREQKQPPAGPTWTCAGCGQRVGGRFTHCWKCGRERESAGT